jgi:UDP-glucuronate 4-epimerase
MIVIVTGAVRFIRSALALRLLERGDTVIGVINHNNYYDPAIKKHRLVRFSSHPKYSHRRIDLIECKFSWDVFICYIQKSITLLDVL